MFHWFSANHLVANAGKCLLSTSSIMPVDIHISNTEIFNEETVKLLGVNLAVRVIFDFHVNTLKKKQVKKYHALARMCNPFITSQFPYALLFECPIVGLQ